MEKLSKYIMLTLLLKLLTACASKPQLIESKYNSATYYHKNNSIYYRDKTNGLDFYPYTKIKGADEKSFKIIYGSVGKDSKNVYFKDKKQPLVDTETFRLHGGHLKDKNNIYRRGNVRLEIIENKTIDVASL